MINSSFSIERLMAIFSTYTQKHPWRMLTIAGFLLLISASTIPMLGVTTSRHGLVDSSNPYQQRLNNFLEHFGDQNTPILVIDGGSPQERRAVVDDLTTRLQALPEYRDRVMGGISPDLIAELLFLHQPELLQEIAGITPDHDINLAISRGPLYWGEIIYGQLEVAHAALQTQWMMPFGNNNAATTFNQHLPKLTAIINALNATLTHENPWLHLNKIQGNSSSISNLDKANYLIDSSNNHHIITLFPVLENDEIKTIKPIVEQLRSIRDEVLLKPQHKNIKVYLTGLSALAVDEMNLIKRGLLVSSLFTTCAILLLFLFTYRSLVQTALAAIPIVIGIIITLAFVSLTYGSLNIITASCLPILLGLGIDCAVHLLARYNESRAQNNPPEQAITECLCGTGRGIFIGTTTTAIAFLTTATTKFTAFAELGIITAFGLIVMLIGTLLVLPSIFKLAGNKLPVANLKHPSMLAISTTAKRDRHLITILLLLLTPIGLYACTELKFNIRYFDFLPEHTESARGLNILEKDNNSTPIFATITANTIEETRTLSQALISLPEVSTTQSVATTLPALNPNTLSILNTVFTESHYNSNNTEEYSSLTTANLLPLALKIQEQLSNIGSVMPLVGASTDPITDAQNATNTLIETLQAPGRKGELNPILEQVSSFNYNIAQRALNSAYAIHINKKYNIDNIPQLIRQRFVSKDNKSFAIYIYPAVNIWDINKAQQFTNAIEKISKSATGFAITFFTHSQLILRGFQRAALIAIIIIFILLWLDFRSLKITLYTLIPIIIGWLWMLAIMHLVNIQFNIANIIALPLVLGIGIDAAVHIMHRYKEESQNGTIVADLNTILENTGTAVTLASLTTTLGFAGLLFGDYGGMKSLGSLMIIGVICTISACLLIIPLLLLITKRAK